MSARHNISELLARVLSGSWRLSPPPLEIRPDELDVVIPALVQTGAGALGWRRLPESLIQNSAAAEELLQAYQIHSVQAVLHELEIKESAQLLHSNGIEPILVKGWSIARLYLEPGLRPYGDIDLCVNPNQYSLAKKVARKLAAKGIRVDLHRGFERFGQQPWDDLYSRTHRSDFQGIEVRILGPEDHLRLLCFHFLREGAWRPLWLCDVAVAIETRPAEFDWNLYLGPNDTIANYAALTVQLAQLLLQANLDGIPDQILSKRMPGWLLPAVLKEWRVRSMYQRHRAPLSSAWRRPISTLRTIRSHWPTEIEATISLNAAFDNAPRWPLQVGSCFRRISDFRHF